MDLEDEKTPLEKLGIRIPDELDGLFGDPPLLEAEDPNLYWGLLAGMIRDRNPQSFPEWIYVYDMVHKLWEEQRLKRASTGLMRGEMFNALMYFLMKISADGVLKRSLKGAPKIWPSSTSARNPGRSRRSWHCWPDMGSRPRSCRPKPRTEQRRDRDVRGHDSEA